MIRAGTNRVTKAPGCQVPLEVTNVPDKQNIKVPLLETDDRRPISAFTIASSVVVNSGGATKGNSVDSRIRPVATTAPLLPGESVQRRPCGKFNFVDLEFSFLPPYGVQGHSPTRNYKSGSFLGKEDYESVKLATLGY